jgi:hypothetical protein
MTVDLAAHLEGPRVRMAAYQERQNRKRWKSEKRSMLLLHFFRREKEKKLQNATDWPSRPRRLQEQPPGFQFLLLGEASSTASAHQRHSEREQWSGGFLAGDHSVRVDGSMAPSFFFLLPSSTPTTLSFSPSLSFSLTSTSLPPKTTAPTGPTTSSSPRSSLWPWPRSTRLPS